MIYYNNMHTAAVNSAALKAAKIPDDVGPLPGGGRFRRDASGKLNGLVDEEPALRGMLVAEYAANLVKKSVVGTGHAEKNQVALMVKTLLPSAVIKGADAADALAIAICHAHHRVSAAKMRALA